MSENKRFNFNLIFGEDEHKGTVFDNGKVLKTTDVVYLLNKLSEENEWLKKSIKRQNSSNEECSKYIQEVAKENEELKKEVENLKDINARCCNEYSYFHKRMMKLEKENGDVE